ncbi:unnamed protein product [Hyaloperonospora brassicae]|uniref:MPN domain-containing protein n=1 Tax=Hyaloperonospora brassicae TaxID=162125 RepID=A0AAV0TU03_HYABA|nr:unnamed protein product [Hyaloperonospora brassicae]
MVAPGARRPTRPSAASQEAMQSRAESLALVEERFRDFDVVWAKVHGFPWWPGVLFFSWDVVRRAGIRIDPKIMEELVVPPPERVEQPLDPATRRFRLKRHCLIMFLDKFNFSVVEIDATCVASFTTHYNMYERAVMGGKGSRKKSEFKRALVKATQLLHMGKGAHVNDDLAMLAEPSPMERGGFFGDDAEMDSEEEKQDETLDNMTDGLNNEDATAGVVEKKAGEKNAVEKLQRKSVATRGSVMEAKDVAGDSDVMSVATARPRHRVLPVEARSRGQKPLRREVLSAVHVARASRSPPLINLTDSLERKQRVVNYNRASGRGSGKLLEVKKARIAAGTDNLASKSTGNSRAEVSVRKDMGDVPKRLTGRSDGQQLDKVADNEKPDNLVLTPLSSIWTTGLSNEPSAESKVQTSQAYKQDFLWDSAVFSNELSLAEKKIAVIERKQMEDTGVLHERLSGKRQSRSAQQSHIRHQMVAGDLDPHTMVQCAAYRPKGCIDDPSSRSRGGPMLDPPFRVMVHPDAVFVADLHAHLATCEIIGFLGGKWDEALKTLYIQAAFPCRSLVIDGDDGSTDVEMDPGSEIELRSIIENAQLEVVGWYHSHPAFAPDPSVRDIENQTSYQQLFQRPCKNNEVDANSRPSEPFVGLIVGTYDTRRSTPVSLFRYFHTRGEKVSGAARREIHMPYEFIPERCHFRSVLQEEERIRTRLFPLYDSVVQHFGFELAAFQSKLPVKNKSTITTRRTMPGSSRRRSRGTFGKRKQRSSIAGHRPLKKARARSRPSLRSVLATKGRAGQGGDDDDDKMKLQVCKDESWTSTSALEDGDNESNNEIMKREKVTLHTVGNEEKTTAIVSSSDVANENAGSDTVSLNNLQSEVHSADERVSDAPSNVFENTDAAFRSVNGCRMLSESQDPKGIDEAVVGLDVDQYKQSLNEVGVDVSPHDLIASQEVMQQAVSESDEAANGWKVEHAVATAKDTCITQSSLAPPLSAVVPGPSASTDSIIFGRKRTRKPTKTTKHSNRSTSPSSDRPMPGMSPNQTKKTPVQTLYDAFRISGPHFANGDTHEGTAQSLGHDDGPQVDSTLAESLQYISVDEIMDMTVPRHVCSQPSAVGKDDMAPLTVTSTRESDRITEEVRVFVASLVEKVVEQVASKITAGLSLRDEKEKASFPHKDVPNRSSDSSTAEVFVHSHADVKVAGSSVKSEPGSHAGVAERSVCAGLQLFGSKGECEDIQTSLQNMADQLDKPKLSQSARPSAAATNSQQNPISAIESKLVVAKVEPVQDECGVERDHLAALRTKYGAGVSRCAEQAITLVDYYRNFERRTDLHEIWKSRITKLEKIESSLSEYVQYLNIPVVLRHDFVQDLIQYLRRSWATADRR